MKYFEEGHHDRRTDRRSQLIKFVSFLHKFRTLEEHYLDIVGGSLLQNAAVMMRSIKYHRLTKSVDFVSAFQR
jgi:hypothetical protein